MFTLFLDFTRQNKIDNVLKLDFALARRSPKFILAEGIAFKNTFLSFVQNKF
ncbi:hypothetical protein BGP_5991 [Beggiatoa sp. PS]|nr:hypothetical protein BGP_5991 [Beggiatoa sp. PS]